MARILSTTKRNIYAYKGYLIKHLLVSEMWVISKDATDIGVVQSEAEARRIVDELTA